MTRWVTIGTVGRSHGLDGSFYVEGAEHPLPEGLVVRVAGAERTIVRRAGTAKRPLIRLEGASAPEDAAAVRGESLLVPVSESPLAEDEWLVEDLVGCRVPGLGEVRRVIAGPSCDLLEIGDGRLLVPLVRDAVRSVHLDARVIEVDLGFLGLDSNESQ